MHTARLTTVASFAVLETSASFSSSTQSSLHHVLINIHCSSTTIVDEQQPEEIIGAFTAQERALIRVQLLKFVRH